MSTLGPRLGITLGDPGGIGPEVALRAVLSCDLPFSPVVYGPPAVLSLLGTLGDAFLERGYDWQSTGDDAISPGVVAAENGGHAYRAIVAATSDCLAGNLDGLVTGPISKAALDLAGASHTDHTTLLAHLCGSEVSMGFYSQPLRVVLVTIHCSLDNVSQQVTQTAVMRACRHAVLLATYHRRQTPAVAPVRIAVAGLNPHAGEGGLFGDEERHSIGPAIAALQAEGLSVEGPFSADTLFYQAYHHQYDVVVAMYHDQGLIPVKLLAFDTAVNITLGLPFVRTSPDHGTAFSLAYCHQAKPDSFVAALEMACRWGV